MSSPKQRVHISGRLKDVSDTTIIRMAEIITNYLPGRELMEGIVRNHLKSADSVRLAMCGHTIVGFSVASGHRMQTPFYNHPVNVVYQRMLFVEPGFLFRGIGFRLIARTLRDLFGWLWPFKRLVAICRTQNPVVARAMNKYNVTYPRPDQPLPTDIRKFCENLLPMLGAESLDEKSRLIGTLSSFTDYDCTDTWNRYQQHKHDQYESQMLNSAFNIKNGRILNSGAFILMVAYAKPLHFLRYINH